MMHLGLSMGSPIDSEANVRRDSPLQRRQMENESSRKTPDARQTRSRARFDAEGFLTVRQDVHGRFRYDSSRKKLFLLVFFFFLLFSRYDQGLGFRPNLTSIVFSVGKRLSREASSPYNRLSNFLAQAEITMIFLRL